MLSLSSYISFNKVNQLIFPHNFNSNANVGEVKNNTEIIMMLENNSICLSVIISSSTLRGN